ncbi:uncharacterized protein AMSG_02923 [Thecamonas trahens ATCC 50062]|uniref:Uncharacterized protein n=1 Tax=Thecamonas trahens ATCC 50062 TaxID=461836 RepID=A0A0L0D5A2_THETB|nr:hypothetical protein AMSG_02923 [Thecamonas trahens ATCC 50062]KNC46488.1 hypothetical protein AMSG_02923 [Thecamonas trahens ATCC 50062]|eukprot:XP_013760269.1 hypothetical protein AMSG_02923 [Thecamonas trahens ATCC 50062]
MATTTSSNAAENIIENLRHSLAIPVLPHRCGLLQDTGIRDPNELCTLLADADIRIVVLTVTAPAADSDPEPDAGYCLTYVIDGDKMAAMADELWRCRPADHPVVVVDVSPELDEPTVLAVDDPERLAALDAVLAVAADVLTATSSTPLLARVASSLPSPALLPLFSGLVLGYPVVLAPLGSLALGSDPRSAHRLGNCLGLCDLDLFVFAASGDSVSAGTGSSRRSRGRRRRRLPPPALALVSFSTPASLADHADVAAALGPIYTAAGSPMLTESGLELTLAITRICLPTVML